MKRSAALMVSIAVIVAVQAGSANATNFSGANGATGCNAVNMADTWEHTFFFSNVEPNQVAAVRWVNTNVLEPTDLHVVELSSVSSTTDVVVYDLDYTTYCNVDWDGVYSGFNVWGLVTCVSTNSARECEKHELRFDVPDMNSFTTDQRRANACHEIGHTLGLMHTSDATSCMKQNNLGVKTFNSHDISHINANYLPN